MQTSLRSHHVSCLIVCTSHVTASLQWSACTTCDNSQAYFERFVGWCVVHKLTCFCMMVKDSHVLQLFLWFCCGHVSSKPLPETNDQQFWAFSKLYVCSIVGALRPGRDLLCMAKQCYFWKQLMTLFLLCFVCFVSLLIGAEVAWWHRAWNWIMILMIPNRNCARNLMIFAGAYSQMSGCFVHAKHRHVSTETLNPQIHFPKVHLDTELEIFNTHLACLLATCLLAILWKKSSFVDWRAYINPVKSIICVDPQGQLDVMPRHTIIFCRKIYLEHAPHFKTQRAASFTLEQSLPDNPGAVKRI